MTDGKTPEEISDDDLDAAQGGRARAADTVRRKTPRGKDEVLFFDEADSVFRDGDGKVITAGAGDGGI